MARRLQQKKKRGGRRVAREDRGQECKGGERCEVKNVSKRKRSLSEMIRAPNMLFAQLTAQKPICIDECIYRADAGGSDPYPMIFRK